MQPTAIRLAPMSAGGVPVLHWRPGCSGRTALAGRRQGKLPPELDVIPRDSMCVISVHSSRATTRPTDGCSTCWPTTRPSRRCFSPSARCRWAAGPTSTSGWPTRWHRRRCPERVSFVVGKIDIAKLQNQPDQIPVAGVFSFRKAYDRARVLKAVVPNAKEEKQERTPTISTRPSTWPSISSMTGRSLSAPRRQLRNVCPSRRKAGQPPRWTARFSSRSSRRSLSVSIPSRSAPIIGVLAAGRTSARTRHLLREFLDLKAFVLCLDVDEMVRLDLLRNARPTATRRPSPNLFARD